MDVVRTGFAC